jgi:lactoylglutathione lyase
LAGGLISSGVKIIELNHVALHVSDVERSCEFYATTLRLERMPRPAFDFPGAWFRLGSVQELHIIGGRVEPVASQYRGNHFALRVEDIETWHAHLQKLGVIIRGPVKRPDGATQIFIRDPDGHVIEVFIGP